MKKMEKQTYEQNGRIPYWDTLKFVLILLVVYGHTISHYAPAGSVNSTMYNLLYTFHIPVFTFISGRFSHIADRKHFKKGIVRLLKIYIVFQAIRILIPPLWNNQFTVETVYKFFVSPGWTLWYLLCLSYWRSLILLLPQQLLQRRPAAVMTAGFLISILGGFIPVGVEFSLQRAMTFLPFFLMGYYSTEIDLKQYISRIPLWLPFVVFPAYFVLYHVGINGKMTFVTNGFASYWTELDFFSPLAMCVLRCLFIGSAILLGCMVMRLVKPHPVVARWGSHTLFIYMGYTFAINGMQELITRGFLPCGNLLLVAYAVIITFVMLFLRFSFGYFVKN